jgi:hypothetical protein
VIGLREVGPREFGEVQQYSADLGSFFASPERNLLLGWTETLWGGILEEQLFPGVVASALALVALRRSRGPFKWALFTLTALSIAMVLGANGPVYPFFYAWVPGYANLRVPTRFGGFLSMGVAGLAACALGDMLRARGGGRAQAVPLAALTLLVLIETATGAPYRRPVPERPTPLDVYLARLSDAVVMEYPFPHPSAMPANDPVYEMRSIYHWRPLVNGYSGNYPREYMQLLERLHEHPAGSTAWIDLIRNAGATHLVVHKHLDKPDVTGALLYALEQRSDIKSVGEILCWPATCGVYKLTLP